MTSQRCVIASIRRAKDERWEGEGFWIKKRVWLEVWCGGAVVEEEMTTERALVGG